MDGPESTLRRAGMTLAYWAVGFVVTAGTALGGLFLLEPVQSAVYDAVYLPLGPSEATETAVLVPFVALGALGLGAALLLGDYVDDGPTHRAPIARALVLVAGMVAAFLLVSLAGYAAFLTALAALGVAFLGVPLLLRYRYGVRSGGVPAFLGGVPVVVLLLVVVGVGLGWGWGYVVTAQEVPAGEGPVATFEEVPAVREDLFAADSCETDTDGRQRCLLSLRGYEHETRAARYLAHHGVRCPYLNDPAPAGSFLARHEGTLYRVSCAPHGD